MRLMPRVLVASTVAAALAVVAACTGSAADPDPCADLVTLALADTRVVTAERMSAGEAGPAHCKVRGVIETEINFELLLPAEWNGRFMMGGGGGFVGNVQNQAQDLYSHGGTALDRGYATVGTDTGHVGDGIDGSWAYEHQARQENFGYRAVHLTAETAKSIITHYYDRGPEYSYFVGCSRGGGQAMIETQRYPDDFDGLVAGAPAYHWTGFTAGFMQTAQKMYPDGDASTPALTPDNLELLGSAILSACDDLDGVEDGILTDPQRCTFTPTDLPLCEGDASGADCVTTRQLAAIEAVYEAPTSNGEQIYVGFPYGGENDPGGWNSSVVGDDARLAAFGGELYKNFVFGDPDWDYNHYDFTTWKEDVARTNAILNAVDTDLGPFKNRNGKIIYWSGWSDLVITALGAVDYYEQLAAGDPEARDYSRLYMLPGVFHCGGGPGPDHVDWIEAIRAWVEDGRAPERLVSAKLDDSGTATLTRPTCPYPQVAVYTGAGSTDDEANFSCDNPS